MQVKEMFTAVKAYQKKLGYTYTYPTIKHRMEHVRELALAMMVEIAEFLEWLPWKPWRAIEKQEHNQREAALELVDKMFFLINLWHALGYKDETFEDLFNEKLEENLSRINRGYNNTKR